MKKTTLIIGAGPAGITFANTLVGKFEDTNFLLVDMGKPVFDRQHNSETDIACGEGGNGLFSDGKFSFFPAGTNVWKMCYHLLADSYEQLSECLSKYADVPEMPSESDIKNYLFELHKWWTLKKYPTTYISLENRKNLIKDITSIIPSECLLFQHKVAECVRLENGKYSVKIQSLLDPFRAITAQFDRIVLAGGRFFPLAIKRIFGNSIPMVFKRYEFGVRLETSAGNQAMIGVGEIKKLLDPKLRKMHSANIEFRTFCWCRNGETVLSECNGMRTYSGRSDCAPTNLSNFGFLIRITAPDVVAVSDFEKIAHMKDFKISLSDALKTNIVLETYGQKVGSLLKTALIDITTEYPQLKTDESNILGPSIEGVGFYPDIDHNSKIHGTEIYCLGDNTGIYRGIIPCMLSGYYLARALNHTLTKRITFVSGNANKVRETERIIGPLTTRAIDLPEYQGTPTDVAYQKCKLAAEKIQGPVIVEDTSLCFNALGGMPGPYIKWFLQCCGVDGLDKIVKMLDSFEDKSAYVECVFAYSRGPGDKPLLFAGITNGKIVKPRGKAHFGWDPIFEPDGYSMTYAEMDNGMKNKISHRHKAIKLLEEYLLSTMSTHVNNTC